MYICLVHRQREQLYGYIAWLKHAELLPSHGKLLLLEVFDQLPQLFLAACFCAATINTQWLT